MTVGNLQDPIHLRRRSGEMDRDDRLRPWGDSGLDVGGVYVQRVVMNVRKDGSGAVQRDHVDRRGKGERWGDHLVPRTDAEGRKDEMHPRRCGREGNGMAGAGEILKPLLEALAERTGCNPLRSQTSGYTGDLRLADGRPVQRQKIFPNFHHDPFSPDLFNSTSE